MANRIAGRPWVLDTATPGVAIWPSWMKIAHFEYTGYAAQGNLAIINDKNGDLVWQAAGAFDLSDQDSFKIGWVQGLIPQQIDGGGKVIVYIE
jgi:outer membrane protein assembly factor BamB